MQALIGVRLIRNVGQQISCNRRAPFQGHGLCMNNRKIAKGGREPSPPPCGHGPRGAPDINA